MKRLLIALMVVSLVLAASWSFASGGGGQATSFALGGVVAVQGTTSGRSGTAFQGTLNANVSGSQAKAGGSATENSISGSTSTSAPSSGSGNAVGGSAAATGAAIGITGNAASASTSQGETSFQAQPTRGGYQVQATSSYQATSAAAGIIPVTVTGTASTSTAP